MENSRGWYGHVTEAVGASKTILPMNVNVGTWQGIGVTAKSAKEPAGNIELGSRLIKGLVECVPGGSVAQIATLHNDLYAEKTNNYGARVQQIYERKPWERKDLLVEEASPGAP